MVAVTVVFAISTAGRALVVLDRGVQNVLRQLGEGMVAELAEGLRFIWSRRLVRAFVLTVLITNLLDAPFPVVMPVFAKDAFGSAADLGLMYGTFGGAALVGALASALSGTACREG